MTANANHVVIEEELLSIAVGNLADIVMGDYAEIVKLFGADVALKMYVHFRGCHISFPKRFYKSEYVIEIASKQYDKREREKIAVLCGYTSGWLERKVREYIR
jgi:CTP-dependent riboflavin kinase